MTARIYPADAVGGLPLNPGRALRQTAVAPFVALGAAARPLGAVSGVRPGTPSTIGSVTSTQWTVNPFAGVLDGESLAIAGPYTYAFDTAQTGAVNAAGSSARTDRLDVQINDSAESDGTPTTTPAFAQIVYTAGTGAGVPAAPPRSHPLYLINVPTSGAPTLTWNATFTAAPGGYVEVLTLAALNAWTPADPAQHATVIGDPITVNNGDYRWDATNSKWVPLAISVSGSVKRSGTAGTFGSGAWSLLNTASFWTVDQPASGLAAFAGTWVAPIDGWYEVGLGIQLDATVNAILAIKKNSTSVDGSSAIASMSAVGYANDTALSLSKKVRLSKNDYLCGAIYVSGSAPWTTSNSDSSFFSIKWIEPLR